MIHTPNLHLIPFTEAHYQAILTDDNQTLGKLLNVATPKTWTEFKEATDALPVLYEFFKKLQGDERWGSYFVVHKIDKELIGTGGYKGGPDENGFVELGYEIRSDYRNRGYASETALALIEFAGTQPEINGLRAHTLPEENFSVKVLRRCGMTFKGVVTDPEDGEVWRWEKEARSK